MIELDVANVQLSAIDQSTKEGTIALTLDGLIAVVELLQFKAVISLQPRDRRPVGTIKQFLRNAVGISVKMSALRVRLNSEPMPDRPTYRHPIGHLAIGSDGLDIIGSDGGPRPTVISLTTWKAKIVTEDYWRDAWFVRDWTLLDSVSGTATLNEIVRVIAPEPESE